MGLDVSQQAGKVLGGEQRLRPEWALGLVNDGQAGLDGGAVALEQVAVERAAEDDGGVFADGIEGFRPAGIVRREAFAGDGDQAAARRQAPERRHHVLEVHAGPRVVHVRGGGEGRVHQYHGRHEAVVEEVVDVGGVVGGDGCAGENAAQQVGAGVGVLVEDQARALGGGVDGEQEWLR